MSKSVHALALGTALVAGILSLPAVAADGTRVAAVIKGLDNPFFQYMRQGIDDRAKELGVEVNVQAAAGMGDSTGQADRLSAVAMQDYGCYLVNPISVSNLVQALVPVAQKDAPIVNIDSVVDPAQAEAAGFKVDTYIGTDNVEAGKMAGDEMLRLLPVVQLVSADWDREKALTATDTILRAHPDLAGIFAANDIMALGAQRAVMSAGSEAKVIGLDGITDALQSIADGQLTATVSQYPYVVGAMGLEACLAAASGHELPANVNAPVQLITKDNAETALKNFPRPAGDYPDPFRDMLQK
jgi:ABC-type sugar transport system substrate-binding protein